MSVDRQDVVCYRDKHIGCLISSCFVTDESIAKSILLDVNVVFWWQTRDGIQQRFVVISRTLPVSVGVRRGMV